MKLTTEMTELLFELSDIEAAENSQLLIGEGGFLRRNLMTLFRKTDIQKSQELIVKIMSEGGYPWFGALEQNEAAKTEAHAPEMLDPVIDPTRLLLTEDEFLDLLPINGYFH